ncbi:MAG TPA: heme exporter protein CcmB [Acidimicrobiales bacterium]|nr:heme exporter protein CcmB [Acidimicrobiales bacterium]
MWRDAALVAGKDLRIELRSKVAVNQVIPFALVVVVLFGLAIGQSVSGRGVAEETGLANAGVLRGAAAGLFWVAVLLSTVLAVQRSFAVENADGARDGLRLSGLDPGGVFLGKAGATALQLLVLEVLVAAAAALVYGVHPAGLGLIVATCLFATAGLVFLGTTYGMLSSGSRVRETLLPLLFFPVAAPVLLGATKAFDAAIAGTPGAGRGWLELLVVFALAYGALGTAVFGSLLEDA